MNENLPSAAIARPYRILALDGGGMRGLYTATLLHTLGRRFARELGVPGLDIGRGFDLITGTSTGGIIACALAAGRDIREVVEFYKRFGPAIFKNPAPRGKVAFLYWLIKNWGKAANGNDVLRTALMEVFGDETLGQVFQRRGVALCIPTVNLATQAGRVFKTPHHAPQRQRDNNWMLVDVCLATSAAPIFLPAAECEDPDSPGQFTFVDGGLWANNPVLIGILEGLMMAPQGRSMEVISVGTCPIPAGRALSHRQGWGLKFWRAGGEVLETALNVQAQAVDHFARLLSPYLNNSVTVLRLPQTSPSPGQAEHLRLDLASPQALRVLTDMGIHDADLVHSMTHNNSEKLHLVRRIFEDMPSS